MQKEHLQVLTGCYLFRGLKQEQVWQMAERLGGKWVRYLKGQMIFQEGEKILEMGILLEGEVNLVRIDLEGNERLFQKLESSYMLGADVICTPSGISPYTAYCSKDVLLWKFVWPAGISEEWEHVLQSRYTEFIANENIRKFYRIDILSSKNVRTRILKYLRVQCKKQKSYNILIPYSREELANYLCVNRSVLSDELSRMQEEGILTSKKKQFTILREEYLPI